MRLCETYESNRNGKPSLGHHSLHRTTPGELKGTPAIVLRSKSGRVEERRMRSASGGLRPSASGLSFDGGGSEVRSGKVRAKPSTNRFCRAADPIEDRTSPGPRSCHHDARVRHFTADSIPPSHLILKNARPAPTHSIPREEDCRYEQPPVYINPTPTRGSRSALSSPRSRLIPSLCLNHSDHPSGRFSGTNTIPCSGRDSRTIFKPMAALYANSPH